MEHQEPAKLIIKMIKDCWFNTDYTMNYIYIRTLMTDKLKWHWLHTLTWTMICVARLTPPTTSRALPSTPTWGRICTTALLILQPTTTGLAAPPPWPPGWPATINYIYIRTLHDLQVKVTLNRRTACHYCKLHAKNIAHSFKFFTISNYNNYKTSWVITMVTDGWYFPCSPACYGEYAYQYVRVLKVKEWWLWEMYRRFQPFFRT